MTSSRTEDLREAVAGLMGRAKSDLAELVEFKSVADPKQYPPEECAKAARWVVDAFAEVGLQGVTMSPTPDGSLAVHGSAPAPDGAPTVLLYTHYDVQPPLGEDAWTSPNTRSSASRSATRSWAHSMGQASKR
jgi:cysteinylglycine-S-conjugate dipeptidase